MAIFGIQLALSMIMASVISKTGGRFSLARYLLCNTGLIRYLHPTDTELRELAGVPKDIGGGKGKGKGKSKDDYKNPNTFHVPKNLDITLETLKVTPIEVVHLRFYPEYHWVLDYTLYSTILYILTEVYYALFDAQSEMNLSVYWCLLNLFLCLSVLCTVTAVYFKGDEVMGERAMCMVMGLVYLLVAMIVLIVDESNLEVGVDPAYQSFHDHASAFLVAQGLPSTGPASKLIIKFVIAIMSGFIGALFTFPGIRMSKMFYDSLKYCEGRPIIKFLLNLAFISPLFIVALWIRPIGRDLFTKSFGTNKAFMSEEQFETFRNALVVFMVVLRVTMMPYYLQAFLNIAQDRLTEMHKEAGRIINTDLQKKVAGVYYYLCIVAVQYITPILIILHCTFMYKTLGGGSWNGSLRAVDSDASGTSPVFASVMPNSDADVKQATEQFSVALSSLRVVFNSTVFRGMFGFAVWWGNFLLLASSAVGAGYLSYLSHA